MHISDPSFLFLKNKKPRRQLLTKRQSTRTGSSPRIYNSHTWRSAEKKDVARGGQIAADGPVKWSTLRRVVNITHRRATCAVGLPMFPRRTRSSAYICMAVGHAPAHSPQPTLTDMLAQPLVRPPLCYHSIRFFGCSSALPPSPSPLVHRHRINDKKDPLPFLSPMLCPCHPRPHGVSLSDLHSDGGGPRRPNTRM